MCCVAVVVGIRLITEIRMAKLTAKNQSKNSLNRFHLTHKLVIYTQLMVFNSHFYLIWVPRKEILRFAETKQRISIPEIKMF